MPISPPEPTNRWTVCTLQKERLDSQDRLKLLTRTSSAATEEDASWLVPCERTIPRMPCGQTAAVTSLQEELGEEGTCLSNPKYDKRVCWENPISDGVYQHLEILNSAGRLKV